MAREPLILKFHPNTIKHLGISLYSTLPPVIAELVANSYDAEAKNVYIDLIEDGKTKSIIVKDDGIGMSYDDIRVRFLEIGRNRRDEKEVKSKRKPIGKKGIGKLSVFGVSEHIEIETIQKGYKNIIPLVYQDIIDSKSGQYEPKQIQINEKTKEKDGTIIRLFKLNRKSSFSSADYLQNLANNLSGRFSFLGDMNVFVLKNGKEKIQVTEKLRFDRFEKEFTWKFPISEYSSSYPYKDKIKGFIYSTEKPAPPDLSGIVLLSRGKLVNQKGLFDIKGDDYAYRYLIGWLDVDFIEEFENDIISTNRESLNWDDEQALALKEYLINALEFIKDDWRKRRREKKIEEAEGKTQVKIGKWLKNVPQRERESLENIISTIVEKSQLPVSDSTDIIKNLNVLIPEYPYFHWRHLHKSVQDASKTDYEKADYLRAALEATKKYEKIVQKKAGLTKSGTDLMNSAFGPNGNLKVTPYLTETDKNIQTGQQNLSVGVISGFRNPVSHEPKEDIHPSIFTDNDCLDILSIVSYLHGKLDQSGS